MLHFAPLFALVFMIGFVLVFDRMHWRRRHAWQAWEGNLMSQDETELLLKILAASEDDGPNRAGFLSTRGKEVA